MGEWIHKKDKAPKVKRVVIRTVQLRRIMARQRVERSLDALFGKQDYKKGAGKVPRYSGLDTDKRKT